jgi:hypothetical protein
MLRPVALGFALALLWHPSASRGSPLPIVETACGRSDWLCYGTGSQTLTTTYDAPIQEWTLTPIQPADPENWRLYSAQVSANGSFGFEFVFSDAGASGSASLSVTFFDVAGRALLSAQGSLDTSCFVAPAGAFAGEWTCTGGDSLRGGASFGAIGDFLPLDPQLPSLAGPATLRLEWTVATSEAPEFSRMSVDSVELSYIYAAVPEPSTALLVAMGMGMLAGVQRARRRRG